MSKSKLIPLLLLGLCLPSATTILYFFVLADSPKTIQQIAMGLCKVMQFGLPLLAWSVATWERTGSTSTGAELAVDVTSLEPEFPQATVIFARKQITWLAAFAFGFATFVTILALYHGYLKGTPLMAEAIQAVKERVSEMGFASPAAFIGLGTFYVLIHSLLEEYYWRWFIFGGLRAVTSMRSAFIVSSLGFMAHHVLVLARFFGWASPATYFFSFCVAVGGFFWAWCYQRTGRLYASWVSHALVDAGIFVVGFSMLTT